MFLSFTLSMPSRGSWNGGWSGEGRPYVRVLSFRKEPTRPNGEPITGSFHYHWDDGWSARVDVKRVEPKEAKALRKRSAGFCGYDWMVDSILQHGDIRT